MTATARAWAGASAAALVLALAACTSPPSMAKTTGTATGTATRLTAVLDSPIDITLRWTGGERGAAGRVVEFATQAAGPYTILQYVSPEQRTYRHPDLIPRTSFHYRLRPYYGPASQPVEVALPPGGLTEQDQRHDHEWAPPRTVGGRVVPTHPVRDDAAAAPKGLKATVEHANGIRFTWTDHAGDEEAQLLEIRPAGSRSFRPAAVLDPDVNSFGLITLPEEKKASYRIRALVYGKQSNVVRLRTGAEPTASATGR
ncbi:fibronectin type III domain-containing protein [Streptomyces sp. NPDC002994]|uniref:fibronectin type III domain-containing protein n=1 Tax=Streptomyces sp. NPDC002994 TaxID=3154441 RepID=UPI0033AF6C67